jgi:hypothetical protein
VLAQMLHVGMQAAVELGVALGAGSAGKVASVVHRFTGVGG